MIPLFSNHQVLFYIVTNDENWFSALNIQVKNKEKLKHIVKRVANFIKDNNFKSSVELDLLDVADVFSFSQIKSYDDLTEQNKNELDSLSVIPDVEAANSYLLDSDINQLEIKSVSFVHSEDDSFFIYFKIGFNGDATKNNDIYATEEEMYQANSYIIVK